MRSITVVVTHYREQLADDKDTGARGRGEDDGGGSDNRRPAHNQCRGWARLQGLQSHQSDQLLSEIPLVYTSLLYIIHIIIHSNTTHVILFNTPSITKQLFLG